MEDTKRLSAFRIQTDSIKLFNLPMPPSENMAYPTGRNGRRFKSKALNDFQKSCRSLLSSEPEQKKRAIEVLEMWLDNSVRLEINISFYFKPERLVTKDGRSKRLDVANRLKGICDSVSESLGFDDCEFWSVNCNKLCVGATETDYCMVEIRPFQL